MEAAVYRPCRRRARVRGTAHAGRLQALCPRCMSKRELRMSESALQQRSRYAENPQKWRDRTAAYYHAHRDRINARRRELRPLNSARIQAQRYTLESRIKAMVSRAAQHVRARGGIFNLKL